MKLNPEGRLRRLLRIVLLIGAASALAAALALDLMALARLWTDKAAKERGTWFDEYTQLKQAIEEGYPNLEWTLEKGDLDLPALDEETSERIRRAASRAEAEAAMRRFVRAFKDGHLSLRRAPKPDWEEEKLKVDVLSRNTPPENACATLEYDGWLRRARPDLDFEKHAPFKVFDDANAFFGGVLTVAGKRVGFVRVASFSDPDYVDTCRDEWSRLRLTLSTTCEGECRLTFYAAVDNRLILEFESRIRQFERAGVNLVVLDLTGNPGGNSWYEALRRVVTGRDLPRPPVAFIRSSRTVAELEGQLSRLDRALAICPMSAARRKSLERTYFEVDAARAEASAPCDRGVIWVYRSPVCSQLTSPLAYESDAVAEFDAPRSPWASRYNALEPANYRRPRVTWRGPLAVLVDGNTASSAELLAGNLQDYGGAIVIGEHTADGGAGWRLGDYPTTFPNSALELHMPDAVAYRRDGSSYRNGIEPDIVTGWGPHESASEKAKEFVEALKQALERGGASR